MAQYIDKAVVVAEIERRQKGEVFYDEDGSFASWADQYHYSILEAVKKFIDTLEVKDPYEQCVQYSSVKDAIQAHAETYSFNIESELFQQLTKEQQELWRKEIEEACINAGEAGYSLANDIRYKENLYTKEVDLSAAVERYVEQHKSELQGYMDIRRIARHFFELGLKAQK